MKEITLKSPAKVNLHLKVGERQMDGYHPIASLFCKVEDLFDTLTFQLGGKEKNLVDIKGNFDCPPKKNLIYKAISLFKEKQPFDESVVVSVVKKIPAKGGLGGGSSNAATTLIALNRFFGGKIEQRELQSLGEKLGSDVPFFLHPSKVAFVSGRGEKIESLKEREDILIKVVTPQVEISTKWAFEEFDKTASKEVFSVQAEREKVKKMWENSPPSKWVFENSFYPLLKKRYQKLNESENKLKKEGADFVTLSGSGSSLVAVFQPKVKNK